MARMRPRIGIALGSGAARGWAHIGVLRGLRRLGIEPDIVSGTSIGSLVGAALAGGQLPILEQNVRTLTKLKISRLFDFQFSHGGIIAGRRFLQFAADVVGERLFSDLAKPFACVCTDLNSGNEVWLQEGPVIEAIRASCALPGLVPAAQVDDRWLLDGALVNPVPVSLCRALGAQLVIAVNLNADGFDELNDTGETIPMDDSLADETALGKWMANLPGADFFQKVASHRKNEPSILTVMTQSLNIVQDRISRSRLAGDPPDVTITPRLGQIGLLQFDRAGECIRLGEEAVDQAGHALAHFQRRIGIAPRDDDASHSP